LVYLSLCFGEADCGVVDLEYEYEFEAVRVDRRHKEGRCISSIEGKVNWFLFFLIGIG